MDHIILAGLFLAGIGVLIAACLDPEKRWTLPLFGFIIMASVAISGTNVQQTFCETIAGAWSCNTVQDTQQEIIWTAWGLALLSLIILFMRVADDFATRKKVPF